MLLQKWEVENRDGGYVFKIGGSHTTGFDNNLFAVLLPEPEPTIWVARPAGPENFYTYVFSLLGLFENSVLMVYR
jgi:hypothetical protein